MNGANRALIDKVAKRDGEIRTMVHYSPSETPAILKSASSITFTTLELLIRVQFCLQKYKGLTFKS